MSSLRLCVLAMLLWCSLPSTAYAAYMDCMEKARGKEIIWDSGWAKDNRDNRTRYKIIDVSIYNRMPDRSVTLTLRAVGRHTKKKRVYKVVTEEKARVLCENIVREAPKLSLPNVDTITEETPEVQNESFANLPFIRFSSEGWVRDFAPSGKPLAVCRVLKQKFSCLRNEKDRYSKSLTELEESLRWRIRDK